MAIEMTPYTSDRGLRHMPPVGARNGGEVRVYESSNAEGPYLWLMVKDPVSDTETIVSIRAGDAFVLARQIDWLVEHHYQGDARPHHIGSSSDPSDSTPQGQL